MVFYTCVKAVQHKALSSSGSAELVFISCGYANWQDAAGNTGTFANTGRVAAIKRLFKQCFHKLEM